MFIRLNKDNGGGESHQGGDRGNNRLPCLCHGGTGQLHGGMRKINFGNAEKLFSAEEFIPNQSP